MTSKIILKKSSVAAKAPVAGDLVFGELAINYTDSKLYFKRADGSIDAFTTAAASAPVTSVGGNIGAITDAQLLASIKNVDGAGSGLDADFLDGNHASAFYLASNPNGYTNNTGTVTSVGATAPLVSSGGTAPSISIPAANSTTNGYMSSAYAGKLDGIAAGATNVTNTNQLTNGAGYITSAALSSYLPLTGGSLTGALNINRRRLSFSSSYNDPNHSIYNNYENIDGEGALDGMKMNVYNSLQIRTGNASGVVPTLNFAAYSGQGVHIPSAFTMGSRANSSNFGGNTAGMSGNSFVAEVRANGAKPTLTFHYEGVATTHLEHLSDGSLNVWRPANEGTSVFKIANNVALHAGNYTSYAPSLTGSGASGTWGINISGNSASTSALSNNASVSGLNFSGTFALTGSGASTGNSTGARLSESYGPQWNLGDSATWHHQVLNGSMLCGFQANGVNWGSGKVVANSDVRGTLFYDYNDTSYYVDPNSGSRLQHIFAGNVASSNDGGWNARMNLVGSSHARLDVVSNSDGIITTMFSHTGQGVGKVGMMSNHPLVLMAQGGTEGGSVFAGSLRSPIFYDSNDTAFYTDPASTSVLNALTVNSIGGRSTNNLMYYQGFTLDANTMDTNATGFTYAVNAPAVGPVARFSTGGGYDLWLNAPYSGGGNNLHFRTRNGDTGTINSWKALASYGVNYGDSLFATIYYDSNDTGYYIDPNSTADNALRMRGGAHFGPNTTWGASLYVGGNGRVGTSASVAVTNGNLHIDSQNGYELYLNWYNTANIYTQSNLGLGSSSASYRLHVHGTGYATSDFRAPIFYDSNDTSYYTDQNSTSRLYIANVNYIYRPSHSTGYLVGSYNNIGGNSAYTNPIYTIGSSYMPSDSSLANMYGIGYSHPNAAYGNINGVLTGWGMYVCGAGTARIGLSGDDGIGIATNSWRSPIFYDSNDTGYYLDPNGTSRLNYAVPNRIKLVNNVNNEPRWDFTAYVVEAQHWYGNNSSMSMYMGEGNPVWTYNLRSNIYYDRDNTGYYADLNSTTYLYYLQSATTVRADSDRRLKENITPITSALSLVRQLQGCRYTRNDLADKTKVYIGMIAQDVLPIVPEVVSGSDAGKYSLGYAELVPVLNEAIKELDEIVSKQAAIIAKLEERLSKLLDD